MGLRHKIFNARLLDSGIECSLSNTNYVTSLVASKRNVDDLSSRIRAVIERAYQHDGGSELDTLELLHLGKRLAEILIAPSVRDELAKATGTLAIDCDSKLDHVPWELLVIENEFVGRRLGVGRITGKMATVDCQASLPVNISIVANPQSNLLGTAREMDKLARLIEKDSRLPQPHVYKHQVSRDQFCDALENASWLHYAGHMSGAGEAQWELSDGRLDAAELVERDKRVPKFVFNNACRSAVVQPHEAGGKEISIREFLINNGGEHFLGTIASILDRDSYLFAESFYVELLAGRTIGTAVQTARNVLSSQKRTTTLGWANYVLYGDPGIALVPTSVEATATSFPLNCSRCDSVIKTRHGIGNGGNEESNVICRRCATGTRQKA